MSKLRERRQEIHTMDMASAQEELAAKRKQLFELRLQKVRGEVKNNRQFPQIKTDIARLLQHMSELNLASAMEAQGRLSQPQAEQDEIAAPAKPARGAKAKSAPVAEAPIATATAEAATPEAAMASAATPEAATPNATPATPEAVEPASPADAASPAEEEE